MFNELEMKNSECRRFLEELEGLPMDEAGEVTTPAILERMSRGARGHAETCMDCRRAVENLEETHGALLPLKSLLETPGPWFTARVMAAIKTKEKEQEERSNSVWMGVRRLAPRLVAVSALLLVAGSTWAYQVRREFLARQLDLGQAESVFESVQTPMNDDVLVGGQGGLP